MSYPHQTGGSYPHQTGRPYHPPPPPISHEPLPNGWEMRMDTATGWPFYIDHANQVTTWQDPRLTVGQNHYQQQNNQASQQHKQQRRIPVPVHHEPNFQQQQQYQRQHQPHQMPVPQPTGNAYSNPYTNPTQPSKESQQQRSRQVPITVQNNTAPSQRPSQTDRMQQPQMPSRSEPTISREAVNSRGMPMPQPQPTTGATQPSESFTKLGDSYTQPKPPAPKPKQQWVDPRITQALETISKVWEEAEKLGAQVNNLQVTSKDRTYLTIEEQLTKLLLKLDSIESFGDDGVRSQRKACIREVQQTLDALELKLDAS